ncbi:Auxin efflux carrier [Candidatus Magnetomorum sp. HK-1]|nr:Auxin efflux carrier [Candidatus Magnetomorum sp. HK-1]
MSISLKFIIFQLLIIGPFMIGMFGKKYFKSPDQISQRIVLLNLCLFDPIIILWTVWGLEITRELLFLPLAGLCIVIVGFIVGYFMAFSLSVSQKSRAAFTISASLSNHGFTLGGFICYLLLGERGLALSYIFLTYFVFFLFMFIFPYARWVQSRQLNISKWKLVFDALINIRNIPLYTTILALILQKLNIQRFAVNMPVDVMLLISISVYYFSLGMTYTLTRKFEYLKENLFLVIIKFLITPACALFLVLFLPLDSMMKSVTIIQSFMPIAIFSVVASILFDLDTRMSSNLFVYNTIFFLVFIFPLLYYFQFCFS